MKVLYRVNISADEQVNISRLTPKMRGYRQAQDNVILRERIAIETFLANRDAAETIDNSYYFASIDNARSFALLHLQWQEQQLAAIIDQVQQYDGTTASSDDTSKHRSKEDRSKE
jgi:hypothetical protein